VRLTGLPAAPGLAIGPVWRYQAANAPPAVPPPVNDATTTRAIIGAASAGAAAELEVLAAGLRARGATEEAGILDAQALMAVDPSLIDGAIELAATGVTPLDALHVTARRLAGVLAALDDPLLAARSADVLDVADRIARSMLGIRVDPPRRPSIAVADDLPPSVAAELPVGSLLGIALEGGTPTAHAAILARALGVPAVVGVTGLLAALDATALNLDAADLSEVALDGERGEVVIAPDAVERVGFTERLVAIGARRARDAALRVKPLATADGHRIRLIANIGSPRDSARAIAAGAEGVGLLRTEFLFMERSRPPTEDEQTAAYGDIFEAFGAGRPVVVRLADIGGDKSIPYLELAAEANPFLGVRAIRLAYRSPDLLVTQIRAISRAAARAGVVPHVMAPMVATIADVELFRALVATAQAGLAADGAPSAERLICGMMVEVPSAVIFAREFARRMEFFSIGTNDLTQYLLAADRTNAALAHLQDPLHPVVLRSIASVVAGAAEARIPVAVCGEMAGDPAGALVLVGLGVDELSVEPNAMDRIRAAIGSTSTAELRSVAATALTAEDATAVRAAVRPLLERSAG